MIRGYFTTMGTTRRPFVDARFEFPGYAGTLDASLLIDTGADRTIISPSDASRLRRDLAIDLASLPAGAPGTGIGGRTETRTAQAVLTLDAVTIPLTVILLDPGLQSPAIPPLLGRDVISRFALFVEHRTDRVFLLEPAEADALSFP